MSTSYQPRISRFKRAMRKFSVSAFVAFTFVAYAIHQRLADPQGMSSAGIPTPALPARQLAHASPPASTAAEDTIAPTTAPAQPTTLPTEAPPTEAPAAAAAPAPTAPALPLGQYRDGDYTGAEVDAYYGLVQVQATIKQGKLAAVQFLEYPNDRRTSIRINSVTIPLAIEGGGVCVVRFQPTAQPSKPSSIG